MIAFCDPADDTEREARSDRKSRLIELASMVDEFGLSIEEAEAIVGVNVDGEPLPSKRIFVPPPDWLAELCAEVRESWDQDETKRRIVGDKSDCWDMPELSSRELGW